MKYDRVNNGFVGGDDYDDDFGTPFFVVSGS